MITAEWDFWKFDRQIARYVDELGLQAGPVARKQFGFLAHQIMSDLPPSGTRRSSLTARIERDTRKVFTTANQSNPGAILGRHSSGQLHWYQASKQAVYGVEPEMNLGSPDPSAMARLAKRASMGKKLRPLGKRGHQRVYRVNRYLVTKDALSAFQRAKLARVGRMKAGMLPAIQMFDCKKPVPAWVRRHAANLPPGRAQDVTVDKLVPSFLLTNFAPGIARQRAVVQRAVSARARIMEKDIALYLRGVKDAAGF